MDRTAAPLLRQENHRVWATWGHQKVACRGPVRTHFPAPNTVLYRGYHHTSWPIWLGSHMRNEETSYSLSRCVLGLREGVQSPGGEDPPEEGTATHSSTLAWRIPWTEEPGGLQSMGSQRVGHDWATKHSFKHCSQNVYKYSLALLENSC